MMGGYALAQSLTGDLATALRAYQARHRTRTDPKERAAPLTARLLVPATGTGVRVRNLAAHLWPLIAAVQRGDRTVASETSCDTIESANPAVQATVRDIPGA